VCDVSFDVGFYNIFLWTVFEYQFAQQVFDGFSVFGLCGFVVVGARARPSFTVTGTGQPALFEFIERVHVIFVY